MSPSVSIDAKNFSQDSVETSFLVISCIISLVSSASIPPLLSASYLFQICNKNAPISSFWSIGTYLSFSACILSTCLRATLPRCKAAILPAAFVWSSSSCLACRPRWTACIFLTASVCSFFSSTSNLALRPLCTAAILVCAFVWSFNSCTLSRSAFPLWMAWIFAAAMCVSSVGFLYKSSASFCCFLFCAFLRWILPLIVFWIATALSSCFFASIRVCRPRWIACIFDAAPSNSFFSSLFFSTCIRALSPRIFDWTIVKALSTLIVSPKIDPNSATLIFPSPVMSNKFIMLCNSLSSKTIPREVNAVLNSSMLKSPLWSTSNLSNNALVFDSTLSIFFILVKTPFKFALNDITTLIFLTKTPDLYVAGKMPKNSFKDRWPSWSASRIHSNRRTSRLSTVKPR